MPIIYETKWFRRHWSWKRTSIDQKRDFNYGIMESNWEKIDTEMRELTAELNDDGWEIKSVVPLISSEYQTTNLVNSTGMFQGAWGGGHGYGASYTDGMILLCQKAVHMSDEEYAAMQQDAENKRTLKKRRGELKAEADIIRQDPIINVSKGMFKTMYAFGGIEYASTREAQEAREAKAKAKEHSE